MDTSWIQVFVLTLSECVAPAGKTVCQEQEFDLQFLTRADCEFALEQLVTLKEESASVIVDRSKSSCAASARESAVFASLKAVSAVSPKSEGWKDLTGRAPARWAASSLKLAIAEKPWKSGVATTSSKEVRNYGAPRLRVVRKFGPVPAVYRYGAR